MGTACRPKEGDRKNGGGVGCSSRNANGGRKEPFATEKKEKLDGGWGDWEGLQRRHILKSIQTEGSIVIGVGGGGGEKKNK